MIDSAAGHVESVDARMLALMRCVLALSALAITHVDPVGPAQLVGLTYISLDIYSIYSATLALLWFRSGWPTPRRYIHWMDVLFYSYLITLTEGTSSIYFYFFFFAILAASFSHGYREGLMVTAVSAISLLTVGILSAPSGTEFELSRTLIRPVYLFTLGCLIAHWGSYEIQLKRGLKLLQEVSNIWHSRFGADHTIAINLDRLREFYSADLCLLVQKRPTNSATYRMVTASPAKPAQAAAPNEVTLETASPLLRFLDTQAATYCDLPRPWPGNRSRCAVFDLVTGAQDASAVDVCKSLVALLDMPSFVTVPYSQRDGTLGRIYVASSTKAFSRADIDFLSQWAGTLSPVVENVQLMDDLISKALDYERYKISLDIHDTTIQPYIGLRLGLDALQRDAGPDNALSVKIGELIDMANLTIHDLRKYAATLRETAPLPGDSLVAAVKEQAERYRKFYGIEVELKTDISARLAGRLAAEAFQIIAEGLSNIVKHTPAKRATVAILCESDQLLLKIGNEASGITDRPVMFTPRSIHERAQALHGAILVEQGPDGYTVVHVTIPM